MKMANFAGRSSEEERRRAKVVPRLMEEKAALNLVFANKIGRCYRVQATSPHDEPQKQLAEGHAMSLSIPEAGLAPPSL
jgi:hypothetical protein